MAKYYEVYVDMVESITKAGKEKLRREVKLVDAQSVTEAEAKVIDYLRKVGNTLDYHIKGAKTSRIDEVIN